MNALAAQLTTLTAAMKERVDRASRIETADEEGSITIEQVLWAVAIIAIVGIVVTVITNYVTSTSSEIR